MFFIYFILHEVKRELHQSNPQSSPLSDLWYGGEAFWAAAQQISRKYLHTACCCPGCCEGKWVSCKVPQRPLCGWKEEKVCTPLLETDSSLADDASEAIVPQKRIVPWWPHNWIFSLFSRLGSHIRWIFLFFIGDCQFLTYPITAAVGTDCC